jgi:hypothetical protein
MYIFCFHFSFITKRQQPFFLYLFINDPQWMQSSSAILIKTKIEPIAPTELSVQWKNVRILLTITNIFFFSRPDVFHFIWMIFAGGNFSVDFKTTDSERKKKKSQKDRNSSGIFYWISESCTRIRPKQCSVLLTYRALNNESNLQNY